MRARRDDEKQARRESLLNAAWELFSTSSYEAVTMAGVAGQAGLAKGTTYLYFATKEQLFLALTERLLDGWFDDVDHLLTAAGAGPQPSIEQLAAEICASIERQPGMPRLLAILHTVLEHNIDLETAVQFKRFLLEHVTTTGGLLEQVLPQLAPGQGGHVLLQIDALVIGLQHLCEPAPVVREALEHDEFGIFRMDFGTELRAAMLALLYGLLTLTPSPLPQAGEGDA